MIARRLKRASESTQNVPAAASSAPVGVRAFLAVPPFVFLGLLQLLLLLNPHTTEINAEGLATAFQEDWLPQRLGNWERSEYWHQERERSSDEGQSSRLWSYRSEDRVATVSVDFPFLGWHELTRCYKSRGWIEVNRKVRKEDEGGPFVQVDLRKPNGDVAYLLFSLFDGAAQSVEPRSTHWRGIRGKLAQSPLLPLLGFESRGISPTQTTLQIQLFLAGSSPLDESQRQNANDMYLDGRLRIVKRWQTVIAGE